MGKAKGGKRGGKRGGGRGRARNPKKVDRKPLTAEELDAELAAYMMKDKERGKDFLDAELEAYNAKRGQSVEKKDAEGEQPAAPAAAEDAPAADEEPAAEPEA